MTKITHARLKELIRYEPETGEFYRIKKTRNSEVGKVTFSISDGRYARLTVDWYRDYAHRFAWFYIYGVWPSQQIDHINRIKSDNRIANLRDIHVSINQHNVIAPSSNNTSGYRGVTFNHGKWEAKIAVNKRTIRLGRYCTPSEAFGAYVKAKKQLQIGWVAAE